MNPEMVPGRMRAILVSAASFGVMSLLPKVLAIAKDMAVASSFGAAQTLDIYLMAFVLIGAPVAIIVVALQTTLIPALVNKPSNTAAGLLGGAVKLVIGLLVMVLPIWLTVLPFALGMLYPGSAEGVRNELLTACLWLIPYYFTNGINLLFYGALQARKVFWPNALLPGLFPIAILAAVWLMPTADIHSLLMGTVVGSVLEGVALYFVLKREQLLRLLQTAGSGLMPVVRLALPLMAGCVIASFAPVIEQLIAFRLVPGAVSLLSYGNKVPMALNSLLVTAIGIVVLPHFAEFMARQEWISCRKLYFQLSCIALGGGVLVAATGAAFAEDIIRLLFERGAFTAVDTQQASAVMRVYLLQLPFVLAAMVSMRALVAMCKTLIMTLINTGQVILAGCLAYFFSSQHGVVGVAFGTVVATMSGAAVLGVAAWHGFKKLSRDSA